MPKSKNSSSKSPGRKAKAQCNCIALVNKRLEDENTELDTTFSINFVTGKISYHLPVKTRKINPELNKRKRMKTVYGVYCPFCGRKTSNPFMVKRHPDASTDKVRPARMHKG